MLAYFASFVEHTHTHTHCKRKMIKVLGSRGLFRICMHRSVCKSKSIAARALPKFKALGLSSPIVEALSTSFQSLDMREPTPIQKLGIPAALTGKVINTHVQITTCFSRNYCHILTSNIFNIRIYFLGRKQDQGKPYATCFQFFTG